MSTIMLDGDSSVNSSSQALAAAGPASAPPPPPPPPPPGAAAAFQWTAGKVLAGAGLEVLGACSAPLLAPNCPECAGRLARCVLSSTGAASWARRINRSAAVASRALPGQPCTGQYFQRSQCPHNDRHVPCSAIPCHPCSPCLHAPCGTQVILSLALFLAAGLCEIGGGWLVWQAVRLHKGWWMALLGAIVLFGYGLIPCAQPVDNFGRVSCCSGLGLGAGRLGRLGRWRRSLGLGTDCWGWWPQRHGMGHSSPLLPPRLSVLGCTAPNHAPVSSHPSWLRNAGLCGVRRLLHHLIVLVGLGRGWYAP